MGSKTLGETATLTPGVADHAAGNLPPRAGHVGRGVRSTRGLVGDKVGRVRAMSASILTYSLCTGLGYFAQEPWHLGALRFIAAFGMGGEWALGVALVMEIWPARYRPMLAGVIGAAARLTGCSSAR